MRLLPLLLLLACGSEATDDSATLPTGTTSGSTSTSTTDVPPTHDAAIQKIWNRHCGETCHINDDDGGLVLDDAFDKIVGVPSFDVPGMNLVEPGSLDDSYLWRKIDGTHLAAGGTGASMPRGIETLPQKKRDKIAQWILDGAPR